MSISQAAIKKQHERLRGKLAALYAPQIFRDSEED
jgi:hypothetical protein